MKVAPFRFIGEAVEAVFDEPPVLAKRPGCPQGFIWQGNHYHISALLAEWHDYRRRGTLAHNMRPTHAATAKRRGSWGVGQDYYRVQTAEGRIFDIYFDRAPKDIDRRQSGWFLHQELSLQP